MKMLLVNLPAALNFASVFKKNAWKIKNVKKRKQNKKNVTSMQ